MDRVKLEPLQRLELEDARAFHDLPYEHMRRLVGHLLGSSDVITNAGGGLLTMPVFTYNSNTQTLSLESFSYIELTPGGASLVSGSQIGTPEARIIRFNETDQDHVNHPVDISSHSANATAYNIYARWFRVNTDTDARRKWDTSLQSEVAFSPTTRERERVEFAVGSAYPTESNSSDVGRWVKLLDYTITNNIMLVNGVHAFNNTTEIRERFANPSLPNDDILSLNPSLQYNINSISGFDSSSNENTKTIGLSQVLTMLRGQVARILHTGTDDTNTYNYTSGDSWLNAPLMSLRGIREEITSIYSRITTAESNISTNTSTISSNQTQIANKISKIYATATFTYSQSPTNLQTEFLIHSESDISANIGLHIDDTDAPITSDLESLTTAELQRVTSRLVLTFPSSMVGKVIKSINCFFVQKSTGYTTQNNYGLLSNNGDLLADGTGIKGASGFVRLITDRDISVSFSDFDIFYRIKRENLNLVGSGVGDLSVSSIQPAIILKVNDGFSMGLGSASFEYSINIALEIDNN